MQRKLIFTNAFMSVVQIIANGIILFFLYKFLLKSLGPEQLGIWSLVLATTSVANVANFGLSGSVVKFVAKYLARKDYENASRVIQTASLSTFIFIGLALLVAYPIIRKILEIVVAPEHLSSAILILPYSLFSLLLMAITNVFQAGLDGAQKIYLRNFLSMAGMSLYFVLCLILVPKYGLMGVAYSQISQVSIILIISLIMLKKEIVELPVIPARWDKKIFKEIIGYGVNFQLISITTMFYDPTTKALLSKFGGLSMVGYYEMANRMVQQFRALIVSANQVIVPFIANLHEIGPERIRSVYQSNYNLLFFLALPLYTLIIISIPLISEIWIGHYERMFVFFGVLLCIGNFLNTLAVPSYFANLGTGRLRWNVISHIAIAILNTGLGVILGFLFGGYGVVVAWVIALTLGSAVIYLAYHINNKIPLGELFPRNCRVMAGVYIIILLIFLIIQPRINQSADAFTLNILLITAFLFVMTIPLYFHPMRKRLIGWVMNDLLNKKGGITK